MASTTQQVLSGAGGFLQPTCNKSESPMQTRIVIRQQDSGIEMRAEPSISLTIAARLVLVQQMAAHAPLTRIAVADCVKRLMVAAACACHTKRAVAWSVDSVV